ncbi:MAG: saccharopine dehydrogenase family protein, partial [Acidimicrobiales bacterium]
MRAFVVGAGAVGGRAARTLMDSPRCSELVVIEPAQARAELAVQTLGDPARLAHGGPAQALDDLRAGDVVVLALPSDHGSWAVQAVDRGAHVVSVSHAEQDVRDLLALDGRARRAGCHVVVGAGFSPGLSCVLARHAASIYDAVEEIHVARVGTGGPACAQSHHRLLAGKSLDWRDGEWARAQAGAGRELCWFPDPVGGRDCYRAELPDALLLAPAFSGVKRVTARLAATRRDRLTRFFPMLRSPHPEGLAGALRVEVRGRRGPSRDVTIYGAFDRPALAAGVVAGVAATWMASGPDG